MSVQLEDLTDNPLLVESFHFSYFVKVSSTVPPKTPLGPNWNYKPCVLPNILREDFYDRIKNFEIHKDDTWVIAYPKSGTTWTQALVWMLQNNLDYELEQKYSLPQKFPMFEYLTMFDTGLTGGSAVDMNVQIKNLPQPRLFKSHLPVSLLPTQMWTVKPKIIYVTRNPKDIVISYFKFLVELNVVKDNFEDYAEVFLADLNTYSPFHDHILEYWQLRNEENILILNYEDMKCDHLESIKKTAKFLGKNYTDEQLEKLRDHLTIDKMRENFHFYEKSSNETEELFNRLDFDKPDHFLRKGKAGTFLEEMSPELIQRFDDWSQRELEHSDFKFSM